MRRWWRGALEELEALLTPTNVALAGAAALIVSAIASGATVLLGSPPLDARGHPIAADLLARITGGAIVLAGQADRLYDTAHQFDVSRAVLGASPRALTLYTAPPALALLYAPLSRLPYGVAAALWTALSMGLVALSVRLLWPIVPRLHRHGLPLALLLAFSYYPTIELLGNGQDAAFTLVLYAGGLRLILTGRGTMAGAVLGLGALKPQLFVLVPIWLAARGRWRALAAWIAVASGLAAGSVAIVGVEGALGYPALLASPIYNDSERAVAWKTLSWVGPFRQVLPPEAVFPTTVVATALGALALWRLCRRTRDEALAYAQLVLVVALLSPKAMTYDYVILIVPAAILLDRLGDDHCVRLALAALAVLLFSAAGRQAAFGAAPWPISVLAAQWTLVPVAYLALASWRAARPAASNARPQVAGATGRAARERA